MRFETKGARSGLLPMLATLLLLAGCGGDSGTPPEETPDCAISGVNTSAATSWLTGETVNIRWTRNGVPATVLIELLKGGTVVDTIAAATANDGFHPWPAATGGQPNGSDFGVRVTGTGTPGCGGEVNGLTITNVANCALTVGAVADSISAGDLVDITWTSFHTSGSVDIELWDSMEGFGPRDLIGVVAYGAPDTGGFSWLADSFHNGSFDFYRYVIRDAQVGGCEAVGAQFEMRDDVVCAISVLGPGQGQIFRIGAQLRIELDQVNGSGVVNLRLYTGERFVAGGQIADDVSVLDDYLWTVTDFGHTGASNFYRIKAFDASDSYCTGETSRFEIVP